MNERQSFHLRSNMTDWCGVGLTRNVNSPETNDANHFRVLSELSIS